MFGHRSLGSKVWKCIGQRVFLVFLGVVPDLSFSTVTVDGVGSVGCSTWELAGSCLRSFYPVEPFVVLAPEKC